MPKDFRYDPFNDDLQAIGISGETHIIPSNSPYVIRLNEVPDKSTPSTLSMTIAGVVASEVAATPAAGEFRPDYSTSADNDSAWNTGLIQFSSADAGKIVVAAYQGIGTLASVTSNQYPGWWLDRGDGSDGDFAPASNTTLDGLYQFKSINIPAGVEIVAPFTHIKCAGSAVIAGSLTATGHGASGGAVPSGETEQDGRPGGTGYRGGNGGNGGAGASGSGGSGQGGSCEYVPNHVTCTAGRLHLSAYEAGPHLGAGGGSGGRRLGYSGTSGTGGTGGGTILLIATEVKVLSGGGIYANGLAGASSTNLSAHGGGGGGGGGGVVVVARTIVDSGTIQAIGGSGGGGSGTSTAGADGAILIKELGV